MGRLEDGPIALCSASGHGDAVASKTEAAVMNKEWINCLSRGRKSFE